MVLPPYARHTDFTAAAPDKPEAAALKGSAAWLRQGHVLPNLLYDIGFKKTMDKL